MSVKGDDWTTPDGDRAIEFAPGGLLDTWDLVDPKRDSWEHLIGIEGSPPPMGRHNDVNWREWAKQYTTRRPSDGRTVAMVVGGAPFPKLFRFLRWYEINEVHGWNRTKPDPAPSAGVPLWLIVAAAYLLYRHRKED